MSGKRGRKKGREQERKCVVRLSRDFFGQPTRLTVELLALELFAVLNRILMPVVTCPGGSNIDMSGSHARVTALSNIYAAVGVAYV
eukprot:112555-Prorocentrum_minimum.AAC.1